LSQILIPTELLCLVSEMECIDQFQDRALEIGCVI